MKKFSLVLSLFVFTLLTLISSQAYAFTPFDFFVAARTDRPTGDPLTDPDVRIESHVNGPKNLAWTDTGTLSGSTGVIQIAADILSGQLKLFGRADGTNQAATEGRVVFGDTFTLTGPGAVANAILGFAVDGVLSSNISGSLGSQRAEIRARIAPKGLLSAPEVFGPGVQFFPDFNLPFADNISGLLADQQNIFVHEGVFAPGGSLTPVTGPVNENVFTNLALLTGVEYQMVYQLQSTLIPSASTTGTLGFLEHDFLNTAIPTLFLPSGFSASTASGSTAFFSTISSPAGSAIPEPTTVAMLGLGLAIVGLGSRFRKFF